MTPIFSRSHSSIRLEGAYLINKMIPYGRQNINQLDIDNVVEALKNDFITQGTTVDKFENELAKYLDVKHVIVVSNGTAALHIASLALCLQEGDAVIVPAISFVATSNAVLYCGATPVFADINPISGNICINSAEKAYQLAVSKNLKVKAIYPVHFSGKPCNPLDITNFATKYGLKIVEDACHAIGSEYRKSKDENFVMTGKFSNMAIWSFHPVKHITTGEGGAVSTNDPVLASKLRSLRSHGITKNSHEFQNKTLSEDGSFGGLNPWYYEMNSLGFNYRLPDILCALGLSQLKRISSFIKSRREIAAFYRDSLKNIDFALLPEDDSDYTNSSYHLFPLQIDFKMLGKSRKFVMDSLRTMGIGTQVHYMPICWHSYYKNNCDKFLSVDISNAENFYQKELSIPMYFGLTEEDCNRVVNAIKELY